jgi:hypothetical protein
MKMSLRRRFHRKKLHKEEVSQIKKSLARRFHRKKFVRKRYHR